jgi:hypothetical protein
MTWVIGSSTMFGYGVVMSDICVTCGDTGITMDVLQKAFPMGPFMVAGLAGEVGVGLTLLRSMQLFLRRLKPEPDDCYDPVWVAENWSKEARQIYSDISHDMHVGDVHIITVGLQVNERVLGRAIPCVTIYKSPEFSPETVVGGNRSLSIGSGAHVDIYRNNLEHMLEDRSLVYMNGEIGSIGGFGRLVWQMIQRDIKNNPVEGISDRMQLFLVRLGQIEEWRPPNMPELATNWPELLSKIDKRMNTRALTT